MVVVGDPLWVAAGEPEPLWVVVEAAGEPLWAEEAGEEVDPLWAEEAGEEEDPLWAEEEAGEAEDPLWAAEEAGDPFWAEVCTTASAEAECLTADLLWLMT